LAVDFLPGYLKDDLKDVTELLDSDALLSLHAWRSRSIGGVSVDSRVRR
jgi:hypothetical protein